MSVIYIDTSSIAKGAERFKNMSKELAESVDDVLNANVLEMEEKAKQRAPGDRGFLRQNISADISKPLHKELTVNAFYASYMEFGTGVYAAQYASSLPADWQTFAAQFKGSGGGGTFAEMVKNIAEWVRRKGIASGNDINSAAYLIARSILINGVKPQPFLFPAYMAQLPQLKKDLDNALKAFGK